MESASRRTFRLDGDTTRSSAGTLEMKVVTAIMMKRVSPIVIIYSVFEDV